MLSFAWLVLAALPAAERVEPTPLPDLLAMTAQSRESQVLEAAGAFARKQGYVVDDYVARAQHRGQEWEVIYRRPADAKARPGDFFTVYVDDRTLVPSRLVPGK